MRLVFDLIDMRTDKILISSFGGDLRCTESLSRTEGLASVS